MTHSTPIACAGVICFRGDDVLLIQRGTPPRQGEWSIPGGRIDPGETPAAAAERELMEETGVSATLGPRVAIIPAHFVGKDYLLHDYLMIWTSGDPVAGDDADAAEFVSPERLKIIPMWPKTHQVIRDARVLYGKLKNSGAIPNQGIKLSP